VSRLYTLHELALAEQDRLRAGLPMERGLPSGIGLECLVPGGIPRDKVTTVFSDEGTFKTTLVTQMQYSMAQEGPVVSVSLEDSTKLVTDRLLGRMSGISFGRIHGGLLTDEERAVVYEAELSPLMKNMYVVDDIEPTMQRCMDAALAVPGCRALFIDYVQLLDGKDQKTTLEEAMKSAQLFAKRHRIGVVLVSQRKAVDQEGPRAASPRPVTGDMFGSSALRMGTKLAVGLFRPWMWCKAPTQAKGPYGPYVRWLTSHPDHVDLYPNILEVHVTKQVCGPPGAYHVLVQPETGVITPYRIEGFP
jgi:KaiC/GvpD/RAD55 family RecA-like ATPase